MNRERRFGKSAMTASLLAAAAVPALAFYLTRARATAADPSAPMTPAALTVTTGTASAASMPARVSASGTVTPWREISVGTEIGGLTVRELLVDEGDRVERGQVIARLADAVIRAQAEGQRAAVSEAEANLALARLQARNARDLVPSRAMSREEAEQRETTARTAEARLASARASLAQTEAEVARTVVSAPHGGTVSRRSVAAGSIAAAGTEIVRIVQDDRLELDVLVPESEMDGIAPGTAVTVTSPSGARIDASVRALAPTVDPKTRLGTAHVALPQGSGLRAGMFARADIVKDPVPGVAVPQASLVWREGKAALFRLGEGNVARLVPVTTGRRVGPDVLVSGVRAGDRVVVAGAGFLADGDPVRIDVAEAGGAK